MWWQQRVKKTPDGFTDNEKHWWGTCETLFELTVFLRAVGNFPLGCCYYYFLKSLLNLLQYCFCCLCSDLGGSEACGILVPRPEIEPAPPALYGKVLTTEAIEKSHPSLLASSSSSVWHMEEVSFCWWVVLSLANWVKPLAFQTIRKF